MYIFCVFVYVVSVYLCIHMFVSACIFCMCVLFLHVCTCAFVCVGVCVSECMNI